MHACAGVLLPASRTVWAFALSGVCMPVGACARVCACKREVAVGSTHIAEMPLFF